MGTNIKTCSDLEFILVYHISSDVLDKRTSNFTNARQLSSPLPATKMSGLAVLKLSLQGLKNQ